MSRRVIVFATCTMLLLGIVGLEKPRVVKALGVVSISIGQSVCFVPDGSGNRPFLQFNNTSNNAFDLVVTIKTNGTTTTYSGTYFVFQFFFDRPTLVTVSRQPGPSSGHTALGFGSGNAALGAGCGGGGGGGGRGGGRGGSGGGGCPIFDDGRLNDCQIWETAAIYCLDNGSVRIYVPGQPLWTIAFDTSPDEIAKVPKHPLQNMLIKGNPRARLYRLTDGPLQVNAPGLKPADREYVFTFQECPSPHSH